MRFSFVVPMLMAAVFLGSVWGNRVHADSVTIADIADQVDAIFGDHVHPGEIDGVKLNLVDYQGIEADERWQPLLDDLKVIEAPTDRIEALAFWTNVYNVLAIDIIIQNYPVDSIRDISGLFGLFGRVWDVEVAEVAGEPRSLNEVEHEILRSLGDARIHAAVNCASVSCPPLRTEAFRVEIIDEQFDEQMYEWMANPDLGARLERDGRTLRVSRIFRFFTEDFDEEAGSVLEFVRPYLPDEMKEQMVENPRVRYMSYDWSLNDVKRDTR